MGRTSLAVDYSELPAPGSWSARALCKGRVAEFFSDRPVTNELRSLCAECPVHDECLNYALTYHPHGVWAGTSWQQRQRARGRKWRM